MQIDKRKTAVKSEKHTGDFRSQKAEYEYLAWILFFPTAALFLPKYIPTVGIEISSRKR